MSNVTQLALPHLMKLKRAELEWAWPFEHDHGQINSLLKRAGITRPAFVITDADPAFSVQVRKTNDGKKIYVAVMRNWHGWYRNNIEFEKQLAEKWGKEAGTLHINLVPNGKWHVRQILRNTRDLGVMNARNSTLEIQLGPALGGEVQIYELVLE